MSFNNESNHTSAFGNTNTVNDRSNAGADSSFAANNLPQNSHMLHRDSEPLPTQRDRATDYSTDTMERHGLPSSKDFDNSHRFATETATAGRTGFTTGEVGGKHGQHHGAPTVGRDVHSSGLGSDRHADHHSSTGGTHNATGVGHSTGHTTGHSTGHSSGHSTGHSNTHKVGMGDKIIGTAQELAGKVTDKSAMIEKGHIRKTEGKEGVNQHTV